jgi:hypothetical protein
LSLTHTLWYLWILCGWALCPTGATAHRTRHYVFINRDRDHLSDPRFLETRAFEGAQVKYTWRELEPEKDVYDFSAIDTDLAFLTARGKRLFIQLQDASFSGSVINVPVYLRKDKAYHGGAAPEYGEGKSRDQLVGWVARRWDPQVQARFDRLLTALGRRFDGKIEGIVLPETAIDVADSGPRRSRGFTPQLYRDAVIRNMRMLKRAFPRSVAMQYANFMPGEWRPTDDKGYLRAVYQAARALKVGVGGPDLLPYRPGQRGSSYPLIRDASGIIPTGIAVQDGDYADKDPKTGSRMSVPGLAQFASDDLKVDYLFWCEEEPYYSQELLPYLKRPQP